MCLITGDAISQQMRPVRVLGPIKSGTCPNADYALRLQIKMRDLLVVSTNGVSSRFAGTPASLR